MKTNGPFQSSKNSHFQNEVQNEVQNILTENEFCLHENKDYFHINGFALSLAYVASVSVRFRSKERGTRVKDRAKNGASKRAGRGVALVSFLARSKPKIPFLGLFLLRN